MPSMLPDCTRIISVKRIYSSSMARHFVQRVEANLLMRNYAGFLGGSDDGKGPRIRGPRS